MPCTKRCLLISIWTNILGTAKHHPHHDFDDVRDWWLEPQQQAVYPNLSKMALNLLSIPAMSAAPERLFSSCKITITDRRNKLSIKVIEELECLRSWYQVEQFDLEDVAT
jgi:hypothetical protein